MSGRANFDDVQVMLALKESALTNESSIRENIDKLSSAISELNGARLAVQETFQASLHSMPGDISSRVIAETSQVTRAAAKEVGADMFRAFNDSIQAASDAKTAFEGVAARVVQTFNKRYWVALAVGSVGMLFSMVISASWILPNWEELRAISVEKAALDREVNSLKEAKATLEMQGAKIKPFSCSSKPTRLCVRIDEQSGIFPLNRDGSPLEGKYVVPYGY
jgi:hypothetical protein